MSNLNSICGAVVSYSQAAWLSVTRFVDEVRANSEDDDTMHSFEQLEKESSYESIQYHKSHTAVYEDYLKRKRVEKLIMDTASYDQTVRSLRHIQQQQEQRKNAALNRAAAATAAAASAAAAGGMRSRDGTSAVDDDDEQRTDADVNSNDEQQLFSGASTTSQDLLERANRVETVGENLAAEMEHRPHIIKWIMVIIVAVTVGLFVSVVQETTSALEEWRLETVSQWVMSARKEGKLSMFYSQLKGLVFWVGSAVFLVAVGTAVVVFVEPIAGGSGLPQVMAYLNGVLVRNIFSLRTFCVKTISVIGAVSGGLPCGAEAPFVQLGAAIGAGLSQGRSRSLGFQTGVMFQSLRGSKVRRDFTLAGAACGVAAAFGSPIGGMLFVMEEAGVMWDLVTSTQIFLGSMAAFTATAMLDSTIFGLQHGGYVSQAVSVMFQVEYAGTIPLNITAVVPAMALGAICGLLAVAFTKMNLYFTKMRIKNIKPNTTLQFIEPILVVAVFAALNFALPSFLPCNKMISHDESAGKLNGTQVDKAAAWFTENRTKLLCEVCNDPKTEYSPLGTLTMGLGKRSIRRLLSRRTIEEFPFYSVFVMFVLYFAFSTYINGSAIASGMIIPFMVMGSAVGRMFGIVLVHVFAQNVIDQTTGGKNAAYFFEDSWMDPGVYALIGAGAFLGGATRMTISVPVIMVELSGELRFLLPIMVAIAVARGVADTLCVPLYHQLLHLSCVPYLPAAASGVNLDMFTLRQVVLHTRDELRQQAAELGGSSVVLSNSALRASRNGCSFVYLPPRPTLQRIIDVMTDNRHHLFPVVDTANNNRLLGSVTREDLQVLLALPDFEIGPQALTRFRPNRPYNKLRYEDWVEHENSMFFLLSTAQWQQMWGSYVPQLDAAKAETVVDLSVILNKSPFTASADTNLHETYDSFRTQALRHLLVVDERDSSSVIGIITRKDLLPYRLRRLQAKMDAQLLAQVGLDADSLGAGGISPGSPSLALQQQQQQQLQLQQSSSSQQQRPASSSFAVCGNTNNHNNGGGNNNGGKRDEVTKRSTSTKNKSTPPSTPTLSVAAMATPTPPKPNLGPSAFSFIDDDDAK